MNEFAAPPSRWKRFLHWLTHEPSETITKFTEYFALACVFLIGVDVVASKILSRPLVFGSPEGKISALFWGFFVLGGAVLLRLHRLRRRLDELRIQSKYEIDVVDQMDIDVVGMLKTGNRIRILTLSGSVIAKLQDTQVQSMLRSTKADVTILIANPYSIAIKTRYECDEPANHESGTRGVFNRLNNIHNLRMSLPEDQRRRIDVRVYDNYPSVSLVQCDGVLFSTVYGFRLRGADCPRIRVDAQSRYGQFLLQHFGEVSTKAVPLDKWVEQSRGREPA